MVSTTRTLALVTGASQGIGLATAKALALKHSYHVILAVRTSATGEKIATEIRDAGGEASVLQLDLDSQTSVEAAAATVERSYGYLDVLVNNAGILLDRDGLGKWELYTRTFTTNVIGTGVLTEGLLPLLRKAKQGPPRIVFVNSVMGSIAISQDRSRGWYGIDYKAYDASKAAISMLTVNFSRELRDVGGKVNCVCPGYINSGLTKYSGHGESPEVGCTSTVQMATIGTDGPNETFTSRREGTIPW